MRSIVKSFVAAAATSLCATAATAQGYNTFVIEVPYEFSLPATVETARLHCHFTFRPGVGGGLRATRSISLVNGRASGSLKFGYDLNGSEPDLVIADRNVAALNTVRGWTSNPDFAVSVDCEVDGIAGATSPIGTGKVKRGANGTFYLGDATTELILLEGDTDPSHLRVMLTHADNQATIGGSNATTTIAPAQIPAGLQGLQTILNGQ